MELVEQKDWGSPPSSDAAAIDAANVVGAGELEKLTLDVCPPAVAIADGVTDDDDDAESDGENDDDDEDEDEDEDEDDDDDDDEDEEDDVDDEDGEEEREDDCGENGDGDGGEEKKEEDDSKKMKKKKKKKRKKKKGKQKGVDQGTISDGPVLFHPQRPGEPDCAYYMKKGICKYGTNCRFNHPPEKARHQQVAKGKEGLPERVGQPECKYYLKTGTCKFGGACRYHHPREKVGTGGKLELNFLGLPIRLGEKECPFYMRTGSCKYATNCKFHHPDPTAIGACVPVSGYQGGGSFPVQPSGAPQQPASSWSMQRTSNDAGTSMEASPSFMPVMLPPHPAVLPIPGWNGYPAPVTPLLPPDWHQQPLPAATVNEQAARKTDFHTTHEPLDDFPERPGQPECQYYLKTGNCKFKAACRYHHPRSRVSKPSVFTLSPMGLPLRPDQTVCLHYSRYGICKFGPACKFDHPLGYAYQSPLATTVNGRSQPTEPSASLEDGRCISHGNEELSSKTSYVSNAAVGSSD